MEALTAAFHYETGYLAFAAIPVLPFLIRAGLRARLARAAAVLAAALLAAAWVVLPLLLYSRWAGINQALAGTPLANGYGPPGSWGEITSTYGNNLCLQAENDSSGNPSKRATRSSSGSATAMVSNCGSWSCNMTQPATPTTKLSMGMTSPS